MAWPHRRLHQFHRVRVVLVLYRKLCVIFRDGCAQANLTGGVGQPTDIGIYIVPRWHGLTGGSTTPPLLVCVELGCVQVSVTAFS